MTFALTSIVSCEVLGLLAPFVGSYWGHAMSKCCQYSINDLKIYASLNPISIKKAQSILQKIITWTKKNDMGQQEWHKTCSNMGVPPWKLKTLVKTKFISIVIIFQETFEFKHVIALYHGRQQSLALKGHVPSPQI
jgi:hypothetical protein